MPELHDYDLRGDNGESAPTDLQTPPDNRPVGLWIAIGLIIVGAGIATYVMFGGRLSPAPVEQAEAPPAAEIPPAPLGTAPAPIVVPPLGESDALVRDLVKALSSHPRIAAWLTTDDLVRNFTAVVSNIAEGRSPATHLTVLRPDSAFTVVERGEDLYVDPVSFERYNGIADAVASIDPAGAAKLYSTLKPRIQEAYGELERTIVLLLNTPVPDQWVRVEPRGIGYGYADPKLEELSDAQKQLLRLGPRNMRLVQRSLREVALALGIPEGRLPAVR
jgi:hypothetical protein